ncbi:MAG: hypothetical protein AAGB12_12820 [Pseudomonadota bacterium]
MPNRLHVLLNLSQKFSIKRLKEPFSGKESATDFYTKARVFFLDQAFMALLRENSGFFRKMEVFPGKNEKKTHKK